MNVCISKRYVYVSGAILLIAIIILAWPTLIFGEDGAASGLRSAKEEAAGKANDPGILGVLNKIQDPQVAAIFGRDSAVSTDGNRASKLGQVSGGQTDRRALRLVSDSPSARKRAVEMARNASILGVLKKDRNPDLAAIFGRDGAGGSSGVAGKQVMVPHETER